jgi:hypothetical protein
MTRIAPDVPELRDVPEAVRSLIYVAALNRAVRSPLTWLTGAIVLAAGISLGATWGRALAGGIGALLGMMLGAFASLWCFFKAVVPWRARRELPSAIARAVGPVFDQVRQTDDRVRRMAAAARGTERSPE